MKIGKIVKGVGGVFQVFSDGKKTRVFSRKKTRLHDELLIGDNVEFDESERVIESALPRTNRLKRPPVANVDAALVFLAKSPEPDFMLADKVLINCFQQNIEPMIVLNKIDISDADFAFRVKDNFSGVATVVAVSALTGEGMDNLSRLILGKTVCLAGQSAVGKTTFLNLLTGACMETGELSEKILRGKNTTRHSEIFPAGSDTYVIDTPGFSLLETEDIAAFELALFYPDFAEEASKCRFKMCTHTVEPDCAVKRGVDAGKICKERYLRYCWLFGELKDTEQNRW